MATLSITKSYSDNNLLNAADIDNIITSVETFVNTTGLNDDNLETSSITASSKIKTASITTAKLQDSAVTTDKLDDSAVTTSKILDQNVTAAKLAPSALTRTKFYSLAPLADQGTTIMFHTFNGAVSIPRGWMKCNGDQVLESTYDALHGAGSYEADGIASSSLLTKFLPNMVNKYPIGTADTTDSGASAISSEGNTNHQVDLSHTHTIDDHDHDFADESSGAYYTPFDPGGGKWIASATSIRDSQPTSTDNKSVSTELSSTQSIQPESIEFIYLMKVI